jgi:hypothetical protein
MTMKQRGADHRFLWSARPKSRIPLANCPDQGTGPSPLLVRAHQSPLDRIALDITDYVRQLSRRTYPVVVGFILPKRLSTAPQHSIGNPAGPALQPAHDVRHRDVRLQHYVHMVRHDRPGVEVVGVADTRTILESILDHSGDTLIPQPEWPRIASVEPLVANVKRNAPGLCSSEDRRHGRRSGPGETPSYKDNAAIREPMRKPAAIEKYLRWAPCGRPQKTMVCPTAKALRKVS